MPANLGIRIVGDIDEGIIPQFYFWQGDTKLLTFQIYDLIDNQKVFVPSTTAGATYSLSLPSVNPINVILTNATTPAVTQNSTDPSIFSVTLTAIQTNLMMTGAIEFQWTVSGGVTTAYSIYGICQQYTQPAYQIPVTYT